MKQSAMIFLTVILGCNFAPTVSAAELNLSPTLFQVAPTSFTDLSGLATFFQTLQAKGSWTGAGATQIYSGRFAGTYNINVTVGVVLNPDSSWNLSTQIEGAPPQTSNSLATYQVVSDASGNQFLQVTTGQYSSYAYDVISDASQLSFSVDHTDASGATVTNIRQMSLDAAGAITVTVTNRQNGNDEQSYSYQLQ